MIDIKFYQAIASMKRDIMSGSFVVPKRDMPYRKDIVARYLEHQRSTVPVVYNIESTNACNQTCPFCPRTTLMTRPIKTMNPELFEKVIDQLKPWTDDEWAKWKAFAAEYYGIPETHEPHENHFFLYTIPKVIVLHGYGDPLLDPHIPDYVGMMTQRGLLSYFSCNPGNINMARTEKAFSNGLNYIKYSIDSTSMSVRGKDNYTPDLEKIMKVLEMKKAGGYKTNIVITMIDLGQDDYGALQKAFEGEDVYMYMKSLDQGWLTGQPKPQSIHWAEFCQIPFTSLTVNSSGMVVKCQEDYNGETVLGDVSVDTLETIWNGEAYRKLRLDHFNLTPGIQCTERCDMNPIGRFLV